MAKGRNHLAETSLISRGKDEAGLGKGRQAFHYKPQLLGHPRPRLTGGCSILLHPGIRLL